MEPGLSLELDERVVGVRDVESAVHTGRDRVEGRVRNLDLPVIVLHRSFEEVPTPSLRHVNGILSMQL